MHDGTGNAVEGLILRLVSRNYGCRSQTVVFDTGGFIVEDLISYRGYGTRIYHVCRAPYAFRSGQ